MRELGRRRARLWTLLVLAAVLAGVSACGSAWNGDAGGTDQPGGSQAPVSPPQAIVETAPASPSELPVIAPTGELPAAAPASPSGDGSEGARIVPAAELDTSRSYMLVYSPHGDVTNIQLGDGTAEDIRGALGALKEEDLLQYVGTDKEFYAENIYLYTGNEKAEQPFFRNGYALLRNAEGRLCLRNTDDGLFCAADGLCARLNAIAESLGVLSGVTGETIASVAGAELWVDGVRHLEITEASTLAKLESLFRNARVIANPSTYNVAAVLILINGDGRRIEIELDAAGDMCVIGNSYWYDYGPGTDGDNAKNSKKELFGLLGISAWPGKAENT